MSISGETRQVSLALCQIAGEDALAARVPLALARARGVVDQLIERLAAAQGGAPAAANVPGTVLAFPDVRAAIGFALRLQVELLEQDWPSTLLLRPEAAERREGGVLVFRGLAVRVALHMAPLCGGEGPAGIAPVADHVARLAAVAGPGQVLLTDSTWRALVGNPGVPFVLRDLGAHRLPGVLGRHRLLQVQAAALDRRPSPPPASLDVLQTNRLQPVAPLLGRAGELAAIAELYRMGVRLVTLVGAPGSGQLPVACQVVAAAHEEKLRGGVWWCSVAPRSGPAAAGDDPPAGDLVRSLADALGIGISHARSDVDAAVQLGWSLAARERFLLVVEGLDIHDAESVSVLGRWIRSAPFGRFLCIAPRRLGVPGEIVFQLGALALRPAPSDAARSLLQRVPARTSGPPIDPLRIEPLATALAGVSEHLAVAGGLLAQLSPEDLAGRLGDYAAPHALAWENASDVERDVLMSAARFVSGFEPWQIAAVLDPGRAPSDPGLGDPTDASAVLSELAARSLLEPARTTEIPSRHRYALSPSMRAFLASAPDADRAGRERRWAASSVESAERWAGAAHGRGAPEVLARLAGEGANLLAVVRWGLTDSSGESWRVDLAGRALLALQPVFETRGPFVGQVRLLDLGIRALDASLEVEPSVQVRLLAARGEAMSIRGKGRSCLPDLERGLAIARRWSDPLGEALCLLGIGVARAERPEDDPASDLESAAAILRALEAPRREAIALATAGRVHFSHSRNQAAETCLRSAVELARSIGARRDEGRFLADLARVLWGRGRLKPARSTYREAARLHAETGDRRREAHVAASLGDLDQIEGRLQEAIASYALASQIARETGERRVECHAQAGTGMVSLETGDTDGSRRALLAALAIMRDLGDPRGEGTLVGQLGLVHHFGGLPTAAQDYYQRAIQHFQDPADRRDRIVWMSWLAALHAEQGDLDLAHDAHRQAAELLVGDDRGISEVAGLLACIIDLRAASAIENTEEAVRYETLVRERYAAARTERLVRTPDMRLALKRLEQVLAVGFPLDTGNR